MRRNLVILAGILLLAMSVVAASAQGGGGRQRGGRRMGGGLSLLQMESVQKELKMTQAQIDKVEPKQQEVREKMQNMIQSSGDFQSLSQEDKQKLMEKAMAMQHTAVADILDNAQMRRFDQLELQRMGPGALTRKDVADKLGLTTDQRARIADIQQKATEDTRAMFQGKNRRDMTDEDRQKMQAMRKATDEKIAAVLTAGQQKQWKAMLGEHFNFGPPRGA